MKKLISKISILFLTGLCLAFVVFTTTSFREKEKPKVGFLVHDLIAERWKLDVGYFTNKIEALGGEVVLKNAYGDARAQVNQGKMLIDDGVKVLAVVAQDGNMMSELVDYANKKGAKIIAYDRMINNCDLHYYISYNSVKVGELMADHALKLRPKGNYILLYGPSSDNNAILVKEGILNKLQKPAEAGKIKIVKEKEFDSWYGLDSYIHMEEYLSNHSDAVDVIIASSDDLAAGAIDALKLLGKTKTVVTGQDASVEACKNILQGDQSMTVYKSIRKLSDAAAILSMQVAANEDVKLASKVNNGKVDVPSILFDPVAIDKSNLKRVLVAEGHLKESDLK